MRAHCGLADVPSQIARTITINRLADEAAAEREHVVVRAVASGQGRSSRSPQSQRIGAGFILLYLMRWGLSLGGPVRGLGSRAPGRAARRVPQFALARSLRLPAARRPHHHAGNALWPIVTHV